MATIAAVFSGIAYESGGPLALFGGTAIVVVVIAGAGLLVIRSARRRARGATDAASVAPAAVAAVDDTTAEALELRTDAVCATTGQVTAERAGAPTRA
jgi:hypothetical protein